MRRKRKKRSQRPRKRSEKSAEGCCRAEHATDFLVDLEVRRTFADGTRSVPATIKDGQECPSYMTLRRLPSLLLRAIWRRR
jgi:hypothetical protein